MKYLFHIFCFVCLALFFISSSPFPKNKTTDEIIWNADIRLNWDDFQGRPVTTSKNAAVPVLNLVCKYVPVGDSLIITVQAVFHKKKSWAKKHEENLYVLSHEQGHFDLYEVYARKIRKELLAHEKYKVKNAGPYIDKIVARYTALLMKEQDVYDNETKHSLNKTAQQQWLGKISQELSDLDAYSSPFIRKHYK